MSIRRFRAGLFLALTQVLVAACGGPDDSGKVVAPRVVVARPLVRAVTYVPATQTCSPGPGAPSPVVGPVPSATTHTSGYRVCGPFLTTTSAKSFEFDCPLSADAAGPFRVLVYNGNPDGTGRVSRAAVQVNGTKVLRERNLNDEVGAAAARVSLGQANTIGVLVDRDGEDDDRDEDADEREETSHSLGGSLHSRREHDHHHGTLRVEVVDEGRACSILAPTVVSSRGFQTKISSGNAFPVPELQLFNGDSDGRSPADDGSVKYDGSWVVSPKELDKHVTAVLKGLTLSSGELTASSEKKRHFSLGIVDRDESAPRFTVAAPLDGVFTNQSQVVVSGTVDDPSAVVTVNGASATSVGGSYSASVSLAACWNTITVAASDLCGNQGEAAVRVGLDTAPPVLAMTAPLDGQLSNQRVQQVTLRYSDDFSKIAPSSFRVLLDGTDVTAQLGIGPDAAAATLDASEGAHEIHAQVSDRAGNTTTAEARFVVDLTPPVLAVAAPADGSKQSNAGVSTSVTFTDALSGVDISTLAVVLDGRDVTPLFAVAQGSASATLPVPPGAHRLEARVSDFAGNAAAANSSFTVSSGLPPDPSSVAPPNDLTTATDFAASTAFLYTGPNAIQSGVVDGTIESKRVAVIRGQVRDRDANPIGGVTVSARGHPEYGSTRTREDGSFDLVVNGGGLVTLDYRKDGYLSALRQVQTPWQDYAWADDLVLVQYDAQQTAVSLGAASTQVARGSVMSDADGQRQATMLFPPGTHASMVLGDGSLVPLSTMHVRATEFTVGPRGREAMPAALPATSAYTYAVELSVDEAVSAGASEIRFDKPVAFYVENFLSFPAGYHVPSGYLDRKTGSWVPSPDGRVVRVLTIVDGVAALDTDGDGVADDALGISVGERQILASLYSAGASLWRVPVNHFTPYDLNWPFACVDVNGDGLFDCDSPNQPSPPDPSPQPDPCIQNGSRIECQNQVLGERLPVAGTPYSLHYSTSRMRGHEATRTLHIPLFAEQPPLGLEWGVVVVEIAGQRIVRTNIPFAPGLIQDVVWDGKDGYGRPLQGTFTAKVAIGYAYPMRLLRATDEDLNFAMSSLAYRDATVVGRDRVVLWQRFEVPLTSFIAPPQDLSGWSLGVHHSYDPRSRLLHRGDGSTAEGLGRAPVLEVVAGGGIETFGRVPGRRAGLANDPFGLAPTPDGGLYVADGAAVWRLWPDGTMEIIAGRGTLAGEGVPAAQAKLNSPVDVALAEDGTLYVAEGTGQRVFKIGTDGLVRTVAGTGTIYGPLGDGGPATEATLVYPSSIALGRDGTLYIFEYGRVRKVTPNGIISTVVGRPGTLPAGSPFEAEGKPAATSRVCEWIQHGSVSVARDGSLLLACKSGRLLRVTPDGLVHTIAGTGVVGDAGDGLPALQAQFMYPWGATEAPDGSIYIADYDALRIRRISPDGVVAPVAGVGLGIPGTGPGGPAVAARVGPSRKVVMGADGAVYFGVMRGLLYRVAPPNPSASLTELTVPSPDASELYVFSTAGRHLRTLSATTGALLRRFEYDPAGRLVAILDSEGNRTTIERRGDGGPSAIVGPYGHRTTLGTNGAGLLSSVTDPAGGSYGLSYAPGGLLTEVAGPRRGEVHTFRYDGAGRLVEDADAVSGRKTLQRRDGPHAFEVAVTTALGSMSVYRVEHRDGENLLRVDTAPDGTQTRTLVALDESRTTTHADGTVERIVPLPDPRYGMSAPVGTRLVTTPGGLQSTITLTRSIEPGAGGDTTNLASLVETLSVGGRKYTTTYSASDHAITRLTPGGRREAMLLDSHDRVSEIRPPGCGTSWCAVSLGYDSSGRLETITQGARTLRVKYGADGMPASLVDPLGRSTGVAYDGAGRLAVTYLPGGGRIELGRDAAGDVTSVTPPGRAAHLLGYDLNGRLSSYTPPTAASTGLLSTTYAYNADGALTSMLLPDDATLIPAYDAAGRLASVKTARGTTTMSYDAAGRVGTVMTSYGGGLAYSYDGQLVTGESATGAVNGVVGWTYDNDFRVASTSVNGASVAYGYDADSLLTSAGSLTIAREAATGRVSETKLGAVTTSQSYSDYGELTTFSAGSYGYTLTRDLAGRITGKTETVLGVTDTYAYGYDDAGRLASVTTNGVQTASYLYDDNGNRLTRTAARQTDSGEYDAQDRMYSYGGATYAYRPNGELATKTVGGLATWYDYDSLGNLRAVILPDSRQVEYVIDGLNRRVGKKLNGTLVEGFLYEGQLRPVAWLNGSGSVYARFVYGLHANVPEYMVTADGTFRFITDHLGSPRLIVNAATGAVVQRIDYDEWGQVLADSNPGFQPFGFAGGLYDRDTGLVRFGARDYDPGVGRWTAKDPIGFEGGLNFYEYCHGDPVNFVDPTGLRIFTRTEAERQTLAYLKELPGIGPAIRDLDDSTDINIFLDEMGPGQVEDGNSTIYKAGRRGGGFLSCSGSLPSNVHISYNLGEVQRYTRDAFGLGVNLANFLAHELGHINYLEAQFRTTGHTPPPVDSNPMAVDWENTTRRPGPYRPRHDP